VKLLTTIVALALALSATGCSSCGSDQQQSDAGVDGGENFDQCAGDPASYVRQAFLSLLGRRPKSQAEVDVYVDLYKAAEAKGSGADPEDTVARAIMAEPEFNERWVDVTMDAMHVQRYDYQTEATCWDKTLRSGVSAALATTVRDQRSTGTGDGTQWTMLDLARSAMALDDLTPVYRAQIFSMVDHPIPAANVGAVEAELARRADFGDTFDSGFMHRNTVCLNCHNSLASVTDSDDPALDRFWPVPGLPENAVYGAFSMVDPDRAHAAFRVDNFVEQGNTRPWGWTANCGSFASSVGNDIAGVDAKLASVTGMRSTVFDLEGALKRGFDALRGQLPPIGGDGAIADPDTALAWLVTLKMTEDVWNKVTGTKLTIANYFPRNQAASDLLYSLATTYTQSGYSLKALLSAIVKSDYFNRRPAENACGPSPYTYPNVYDPWVTADPDPAKRKNGPGDAVTAVDSRTLVTALAGALDWNAPPAQTKFPDYGDGCEGLSCGQMASQCGGGFPQCCNAYHGFCQMGGVDPTTEVPFERGVGMFLRNSEAGFRGLDFQARLVWENHHNVCARPTWVSSDFIDKLIAAGAADSTATASDVVAALKDRMIGEPAIDPGDESAALAAIVGPLDGPATAVTVSAARQVCAALLGSPQFLMQGIAGRGGDRPKLTPTSAGYDAVCADVMGHVAGVTCTGGKLALP
jgi:hypothetical protein